MPMIEPLSHEVQALTVGWAAMREGIQEETLRAMLDDGAVREVLVNLLFGGKLGVSTRETAQVMVRF